MTHFPVLSGPGLWGLATGRARHAHLSCDKCKCLERKKGLEKPIHSILQTNEIEINLFEGAQNLNQMRGEFIEACCLGIISHRASSPAHQLAGAWNHADTQPLAQLGASHGLSRRTHRQWGSPALTAGWRPEQRSRAEAGDARANLEVPDVTHLSAEVEVEFSNQQPVLGPGEPGSAATVRGCHVARAIKVAEVLVSFQRAKETP